MLPFFRASQRSSSISCRWISARAIRSGSNSSIILIMLVWKWRRQRTHMTWVFRPLLLLYITKSLWRECDERAWHSREPWCVPTGRTAGYLHLLIFIKYLSTCLLLGRYSVQDCHGISSGNLGKRYDLFIYSEIILLTSYSVRALGIWRWKCLVCTFSLRTVKVKVKWDMKERTPKSTWVIEVS